MIWIEKQGIEAVHACKEAIGNYGEDLAFIFMKPVKW